MGQYKVPQNVESEDKIIGPLTLKQFIYAIMGLAWAGLCFLIFGKLSIVIVIVVAAPFTLLFLLLAFFQRDGQNFEQLLVAIVGFFSQSRQRIWRKEDVVDSFKIEPKKAAAEQSQRNPDEVRSRLEQLANIVDARGWAETPGDTPSLASDHHQFAQPEEDRLIRPAMTSANMTLADPEADDVLDLQNSPLAQNLSNLLNQASTDMKSEAMAAMRKPAMPTPAAAAPSVQPVAPVTPIAPVAAVPSGTTLAPPQTQTPDLGPALIPGGAGIPLAPSVSVTKPVSGDILKLATESDDLTVSQLAAQATRVGTLPEGQSVSLSNGATNPVPTNSQPAS